MLVCNIPSGHEGICQIKVKSALKTLNVFNEKSALCEYNAVSNTTSLCLSLAGTQRILTGYSVLNMSHYFQQPPNLSLSEISVQCSGTKFYTCEILFPCRFSLSE